MRVAIVAFSLQRGGAAIAAAKFARLAERFADTERVAAEPGGEGVRAPSRAAYYRHLVLRLLEHGVLQLMRTRPEGKHSLNLFSSAFVARAIAQADGVVHVHWVNNATLSARRLGMLPRGSVITLHDEWLYCGAEHYRPVVGSERYREGYLKGNKDVAGVDWNRVAWRAKVRALTDRDDLIFTVPSSWVLERARQSALLRGKDIRLLPNPIETDHFDILSSSERKQARRAYGFRDDDIVIVFGAVSGDKNPVKGFDLLQQALQQLASQRPGLTEKVKLLSFGGPAPGRGEWEGFEIAYAGTLRGAPEMRVAYGLADVTVAPSLVEAFGQVAAESLACGTPVLAFATSGLLDIVQHEVSGLLAAPFDAASLAQHLLRLVEMPAEQRLAMGQRGREFVETTFSTQVVAEQYKKILLDACARKRDGAP